MAAVKAIVDGLERSRAPKDAGLQALITVTTSLARELDVPLGALVRVMHAMDAQIAAAEQARIVRPPAGWRAPPRIVV